MTDPDERTINRAIAEVHHGSYKSEDELQDIREEARAALHRLFRDRRRLEKAVDDLEEEVVEAQNEVVRLREEVKSLNEVELAIENTRLRKALDLVQDSADRDAIARFLKETT